MDCGRHWRGSGRDGDRQLWRQHHVDQSRNLRGPGRLAPSDATRGAASAEALDAKREVSEVVDGDEPDGPQYSMDSDTDEPESSRLGEEGPGVRRWLFAYETEHFVRMDGMSGLDSESVLQTVEQNARRQRGIDRKHERLRLRGMRWLAAGPGEAGLPVRSCGHEIHEACMQRSMGSLRPDGHLLEDVEFTCPVCRRICNVLVPELHGTSSPAVVGPRVAPPPEQQAAPAPRMSPFQGRAQGASSTRSRATIAPLACPRCTRCQKRFRRDR